MELKIFNGSDYREQLVDLYYNYFKEVHGDSMIGDKDTVSTMLDIFLEENKATYLLLDAKDKVIGFLTVFIHNQYGITAPTVYTDYMYIIKEYRSHPRAITMLYMMVGVICDDLGYDSIGCTYTTSANANNNKIVEGEILAQVTLMPLDKVRKHLKRYKRRLGYGC